MSDKETKRSPNFPAIPLEESIDNIETVFNQDKLSATSETAIVGHLGYNKLHGRSRRVLSALKQYGLLDELSGRRFKVSDSAFKIIKTDPNSPEGIRLFKEAVFKPSIFKAVIDEYKGELPSDQALTSYLVLDKSFTPDGASLFIKVLRDNMDYANISGEDYTDAASSEIPNGELENLFMSASPFNILQRPPSGGAMPPAFNSPAPGEDILTFNLSRTGKAQVRFNGQVTQEGIKKLIALLDLSIDTYPTQEELTQPKRAVWRNKDHDQPVTVTGELGEKGGKQYFSIAESDTGVPADELEFED